MKRFYHLIPFLALAFPWACEKPGNDPSDNAPTAITLSQDSFSVPQAGQTFSLEVTAPTRPKIIGLPDWISISEGTFGNYKMVFTLTVPENDTFESRSASFDVFAAGAAQVTVNVSQAGKEYPVTPPEPGVDPEDWESAAAAVVNMGVGWNLGNTLESNSGAVDNMWIEAYTDRSSSAYETAWGQPVATRSLIHMFKEAGFNTIRVPVTWYPHMGTVSVSGTVWNKASWKGYDVDPAWMARVKEVVNYVIDEGMYCVLNVHHDTGTATTAWLRADKAVYEQVRERYESLWTQIATEFKDYGQRLIFESFNEMLDTKGTWNSSTPDAHEAINMFNASFVSTVRATGGNNASRNLILNTYAASCQKEALADFRLPEDSAEGHLMAEVHSYAPYNFAFDSAPNPKKVFDAACEKEVQGLVENMNTYLVSKGIPCVLGEFGCDSAKREDAELAKQAACYVAAAKKYNIPCLYWMLLSDAEDRSVPKWTKPVIKDAILKAFNDN